VTELAPPRARISAAGFAPDAAGVTPPANPGRHGGFLTDVVVELGFADRETVETVEEASRRSAQTIERSLLDSGALDEEQLALAIAERNGLDHVDLDRFDVNMEAAEMVSRSTAQRYRAAPIAFAADGALIVAVEDPYNSLGISDIEAITRSEVRPVIATAGGIHGLIERLPDEPAVHAPPPAPEAETEAEAEAGTPMPGEAVEEEEEEEEEETPIPEVAVEEIPIPEAVIEETPIPEVVVEDAPMPEVVVEETPIPEAVEDASISEAVVEEIPIPEAVVETEERPEPNAAPPRPQPIFGEGGERRRRTADLEALREAVRSADALAAAVGQQIAELEGAGERAQHLERELVAAREQIDALEQRHSRMVAAAGEAVAAIEKLDALRSALEETGP
jgi:outer membrane biosynthesis protein TonB